MKIANSESLQNKVFIINVILENKESLLHWIIQQNNKHQRIFPLHLVQRSPTLHDCIQACEDYQCCNL
jgi:hypothetical protein